MELTDDFRITPADGERPGAYASFPYDRELVRRFRESFPRARWHEEGCWFVPGVCAAHRLDRWMTQELEAIDRHADAKGRDDFEFDPLSSDYLDAGDDLMVRTPWSRTIVGEMRAIPWARWDPLARVWHVPYRSVAELRRRWPAIEAAARRNEPEARLARAMARAPDPQARRRNADRRRARYPVAIDDPPPLGAPVGTLSGIVVFEGSDGEIPTAEEMAAYPFAAEAPERFVWARFRPPWFRELRSLTPAPEPVDRSGGWWRPTTTEIDETRSRLGRAWRRREANL